MEWTVVIGIGIIAWWIWSSSKQKNAEALADEMWELRFPILDQYHAERDTFSAETFADLQDMLLVDEFDDYDFHNVKVFNLRRSDGPVWEAKETHDSYMTSLTEAERVYALFGNVADAKKRLVKLRAGPQWEQIPNERFGSKLEVAYQRFIVRYRDMHWPVTRVQLALKRERRRERQEPV